MPADSSYEVRLAGGEREEIWQVGPGTFGRGLFIERIESASELSAIG